MNWFNLVNFILALAPQELALIKAIVDTAHNANLAGNPISITPIQITGSPIPVPAAPVLVPPTPPVLVSLPTEQVNTVSVLPNTEKEVLRK